MGCLVLKNFAIASSRQAMVRIVLFTPRSQLSRAIKLFVRVCATAYIV